MREITCDKATNANLIKSVDINTSGLVYDPATGMIVHEDMTTDEINLIKLNVDKK